ncbi:hypothetical protein DFJ74DRAFT_476562 [Hyaloraphidium curvatum]|nr:hypothetical protein DFJ74DRAFT_476562 [Hyaloraphidium curvatum]
MGRCCGNLPQPPGGADKGSADPLSPSPCPLAVPAGLAVSSAPFGGAVDGEGEGRTGAARAGLGWVRVRALRSGSTACRPGWDAAAGGFPLFAMHPSAARPVPPANPPKVCSRRGERRPRAGGLPRRATAGFRRVPGRPRPGEENRPLVVSRGPMPSLYPRCCHRNPARRTGAIHPSAKRRYGGDAPSLLLRTSPARDPPPHFPILVTVHESGFGNDRVLVVLQQIIQSTLVPSEVGVKSRSTSCLAGGSASPRSSSQGFRPLTSSSTSSGSAKPTPSKEIRSLRGVKPGFPNRSSACSRSATCNDIISITETTWASGLRCMKKLSIPSPSKSNSRVSRFAAPSAFANACSVVRRRLRPQEVLQ